MPPKKRYKKKSSLAKQVAEIKKTLAVQKPETKTVDVESVSGAGDAITIAGPYNGVTNAPYDLTDGFIQGVQNQGQIEGNYCKLTSMDLRVLIDNVDHPSATAKIRLMLVRIPNAEVLSMTTLLEQVLEYGNPATHNQKSYCSPYKRNTTINGGYDVLYDKVMNVTSKSATYAPQNAIKFIRIKKSWKNGLDLRFSGTASSLTLEQNRLYLFAFDGDVVPNGSAGSCNISFVNRLKYMDE